MAWLSSLNCLLGFHDPVYRERRDGIQHYVCTCCGAATPVIWRTQEENERVLARSRVPELKARSLPKPSAAERARVKQALGL